VHDFRRHCERSEAISKEPILCGFDRINAQI
jgi:hypothetical protein